MIPLRLRISLHEASHSLACLSTGTPLGGIGVDDSGGWTASSMDVPPAVKLFTAFCGRAAEILLAGGLLDALGERSDFAMAQKAADELSNGDGRLSAWFIQDARQRAEAFVQDNSALIWRIGTALADAGELSADEIMGIVRDAAGGMPPGDYSAPGMPPRFNDPATTPFPPADVQGPNGEPLYIGNRGPAVCGPTMGAY